jgi:hypothetical protein
MICRVVFFACAFAAAAYAQDRTMPPVAEQTAGTSDLQRDDRGQLRIHDRLDDADRQRASRAPQGGRDSRRRTSSSAVRIPKKHNVVVRYRGTGRRKPILLLAHTDVVEAKREDWTMDPFILNEKDGYFYGRGRRRRQGASGDLDRESHSLQARGIQARPRHHRRAYGRRRRRRPVQRRRWLIKNKRELIDAELSLNEGGMG